MQYSRTLKSIAPMADQRNDEDATSEAKENLLG